MKRFALLSIYLLILAPSLRGEPIFFLEPSETSPGRSVSVAGTTFPDGIHLIIGGIDIIPIREKPDRLVFTVPQLPPGDYTLSLTKEGSLYGAASRLRIVEPLPRILSLSPTNIDECPTEEPSVSIEATDFLPGGNILVDGRTVPFEAGVQNRLIFRPFPLEAGTHGVQLANPGGSTSLPHPLWINNIPEISSITTGRDYISHYELIVEGKNFVFGSLLVVNEFPVGFSDLPPRQRVIPLEGRTAQDTTDSASRAEGSVGENMRYVNCHTIIYNRRPYSSQPKEIILQIVNPDGKASTPYTASIP